jgi:glycosyltransferase involved in cell wall biosynthesis
LSEIYKSLIYPKELIFQPECAYLLRMKVLFTARATLFNQPGGDSQQIVQTADALKALGHEVVIKLNGEQADYNDFDLVHFFNIGRPADIVHQIEKIKVPLVVSTIWVDYSEWNNLKGGITGKMAKVFSPYQLEYFKAIARGINGSDQFPKSTYLFQGQKKSMAKVLNRADAIITSSTSEKNRVELDFAHSEKMHVLPLGLPDWIYEDSGFHNKEGVLCVGRIEGLKNQLNLILAANQSKWPLTIAGKAALNQPNYMARCQIAASDRVHFAGWLSGEHLREAYQKAKVLVLPSYFETFGLVALEAYANGCNLVLANRPDMNAIFKDKALFCDPNDPDDIKQKVDAALKLEPPLFSKQEREKHNWNAIAKQLEAIYLKIKT